MSENELSNLIIRQAMKIHSRLGAGLLEAVYKECLLYELLKIGLRVEKEKPYPLVYDEIKLDCGFRADLVVESKVIVEIKCVDALIDIHKAQLLTYLRLSGCRLGLLLNFKVLHLRDGIKRVVNNL
jgi:GxxExxY protein